MLAGYDEAGGAKGYKPVDHSNALEKMGGRLSAALRASWLPKITNGWFFRAESFFSVARYLDAVNLEEIPGVAGGTSHVCTRGKGQNHYLRYTRYDSVCEANLIV